MDVRFGRVSGRDPTPRRRARLFESVYRELRGMAGHQLRAERGSHTLQPTALVNEAHMRLGGVERDWKGRARFFGAAAQAMRRILIDHAREKQAQKRGGDLERVTMAELVGEGADGGLDVLALNDALDLLVTVRCRTPRCSFTARGCRARSCC